MTWFVKYNGKTAEFSDFWSAYICALDKRWLAELVIVTTENNTKTEIVFLNGHKI